MVGREADIALLTESRYTATAAAAGDWYLANILREDELLSRALQARGVTTRRVDWADPTVDWSQFAVALFRTTWDYFDRAEEFARWLPRVASQTRLCNRRDLVEWNRDKHYLEDLRRSGIPVVPSVYRERGSPLDLERLLEECGWDEVVVKPCVSGSARHTYRIRRETAGTVTGVLEGLLEREALIFQPFQTNILSEGEETLVLFGGEYSHAVKKRAKPGDFRVQDDHGGTTQEWTPTREQRELAERVWRACPTAPVYGRVDLVKDNRGEWAVMELELIEPELWLRHDPASAERLAEAVVAWMVRG